MQTDPALMTEESNATDSVNSSGQPLAPQACSSCRKQKRKCDKQLPSCGLCNRIGRTCDYTPETAASAPTAEDFAALRQQVSDLQSILQQNISVGNSNPSFLNSSSSPGGNVSSNGSYTGLTPPSQNGNGSSSNLVSPGLIAGGINAWSGPSSFPALYFLDSTAFEYERFQVQAPFVKVPPGALSVLGSSGQLRDMIEEFFATVHLYFPIISRIRLYQHLASPLHEPGADIALLFLAMKLIITEVPEGSLPQTPLYQDVKSLYVYVESQNGFSIQLIQAVQLITLYELGHAIWPAAYLSAGQAVRLGHAMGLHDRSAPQMLVRCGTWTEQEERRRVWWGATILEACANLGHRGKPLATTEPDVESHLPIDDNLWDKGQMEVATPLSLSASQTTKASPFARTCQAAHLLAKVCRHLNDQSLPLDFRYKEALQLNRVISSLISVLPDEAQNEDPTRPSRSSAMALCCSAVLTLYDTYSCTERMPRNGPQEQLMMQKEAIDGFTTIGDLALQVVRKIRQDIDQVGLARVPVFVVDAVYQTAANYAWMYRESSNPEYRDRLSELKETLILLDRRWKCAGQYSFALTDFWERAEYDDQGRYVPQIGR